MSMPTQPEDAYEPVEGESLLAWSVRVAAARGRPHVWDLLRESGVAYLASPTALQRGTDATDMAKLLAVDECQVERRLLAPAEITGFELLEGIPIRGSDVTTHTRRYSPATLRSHGTHLALWNLRTLPFCWRSMQYLTDTCGHCRTIQRWKRSICVLRCDRCGSGLWLSETDLIEREMRDSLDCVAALVDAHHPRHRGVFEGLPEAVRDLGLGGAFELVLNLARIFDVALPLREPAFTDLDGQKRLARALSEAWVHVRDWPEPTLRSLAKAPTRGDATRRLSDAIRRDGTRIHLPAVGALLGKLVDGTNAIPVKKAARLLGATETEIATARDGEILGSALALRHGRLSVHLVTSEIDALSSIRLQRIGARRAGRMIGIPTYAVHGIVASGHLHAHRHPWLTTRYGGPVVTTAAVDELTRQILSTSTKALQNPLGLQAVMRGFGGGPKPWVDVIGAILEGRIRYKAMKDDDGKLRIMVSAATGDRIRELRPGYGADSYSQEDALEILNLNVKSAATIDPMRITKGSLSGRYNGALIEQAASTRVSLGELMRRTALQPKTIQTKLESAGMTMADELGWDRATIAALLRSLSQRSLS